MTAVNPIFYLLKWNDFSMLKNSIIFYTVEETKLSYNFIYCEKLSKQFCTAKENIKVIVQVADIFPYQSVHICVWPGSSAWRRL